LEHFLGMKGIIKIRNMSTLKKKREEIIKKEEK
jgi:hypothetical protein